MSEADVADRIDQARDAWERSREYAVRADKARDKTARLCAELAEAGLSVNQVATSLEITAATAQRLIARGRALRGRASREEK